MHIVSLYMFDYSIDKNAIKALKTNRIREGKCLINGMLIPK